MNVFPIGRMILWMRTSILFYLCRPSTTVQSSNLDAEQMDRAGIFPDFIGVLPFLNFIPQILFKLLIENKLIICALSRGKIEQEPGFEPRTSGFLARRSTT